MATKITINFLFCDQGMGTLIRIYDELFVIGEVLTNLALIDLGSTSRLKRKGGRAIESVMKALREMVEPGLDLVVVSHGDLDHWNMLNHLQAEIEKDPKLKDKMKVKKMGYGGGGKSNWPPRGWNVVHDFAKAFGTKAEPLTISECNYSNPPEVTDFEVIEGVKFRLLASGVEASSNEQSALRNAASAVVVVDFNGSTAILPGDATADTIGWINTEVFDKWHEEEDENPIQPCRVLGAPHHGALATIAENYERNKRLELPPDLGLGNIFASYVEAEQVCASAGFESKHSHPYRSVLELLAQYAIEVPAHNWVWYDDREGWKKRSKQTKGIHTTVKSLKKPCKWGEPMVTITAKGEVFVTYDWSEPEIPPYERFDRYAATPHER